ncbi:MAG: hypothetical protein U0736_23180 [Gemmataceae bacterium]
MKRAQRAADELYRLWDPARDARSECYEQERPSAAQGTGCCGRALGDVDHHRGVMPPHVPVWRFERARLIHQIEQPIIALVRLARRP